MYRPPTVETVLGPDEQTFPDSKPPSEAGRSAGRPPRAAFVEDVSDHGSTEDMDSAARISGGTPEPAWPHPPRNHTRRFPPPYHPQPPLQSPTPPLRHVRVRSPSPDTWFGAQSTSRHTPLIYGRHAANESDTNPFAFSILPGPPRPYGAWPRALPPIRSWESLEPGLSRRLSARPCDASYTAFPRAYGEVPRVGPTKTRIHIGPNPGTDSTYSSAPSDSTWGDSHSTTHPVKADDDRGLCFEVPTDRNPQKLMLYTDILDLGTDEAEGNAWSEVKSYPEEHATCDLVNAKTLEQGSDETGALRTYLARENGTPSLRTGTEPRIVWLWVHLFLLRSIC